MEDDEEEVVKVLHPNDENDRPFIPRWMDGWRVPSVDRSLTLIRRRKKLEWTKKKKIPSRSEECKKTQQRAKNFPQIDRDRSSTYVRACVRS